MFDRFQARLRWTASTWPISAEASRVKRSPSVAMILFLAMVCSSCSSEAGLSATPVSSTTIVAPTADPLPINMAVDPLLSYAVENHKSLYKYDETFGEEPASDRARCAHDAATETLSAERLAEAGVTSDSPTLDLARLSNSERATLAEALSRCPGTLEMVSHLARSSEPVLHECILIKIRDLDSSPKIIAELAMGTRFGETSTITGFRFSCQRSYVDALFGEHPGGTLGEDRRLVAEALVRDMAPSARFDAFETSCTARSVMAAMPDEWLADFLSHSADSRVGPADFLANHSTPESFDAIIAGLTDGVVACVRPIATATEVHDLQLTDAELTCLGDSELRQLWLPFMFGAPENAPPIEDLVAEALVSCGKAP